MRLGQVPHCHQGALRLAAAPALLLDLTLLATIAAVFLVGVIQSNIGQEQLWLRPLESWLASPIGVIGGGDALKPVGGGLCLVRLWIKGLLATRSWPLGNLSLVLCGYR